MKPPTRVETFELSAKSHPYIPASTTKILGDYSRNSPPDIDNAEFQQRRLTLQRHSETVKQLRRWARYRESSLIGRVLRCILPSSSSPRLPADDALHECVNHFFPPRFDILVTVCDFGDGRAQRRFVRLGDIEQEFQSKPSWSTVRWIHAPVGVGLLHSSVEALFFHTGSKVMGRPFVRGGRAGWPYLEVETFDLRSTRSVQDSRDLLRILKEDRRVSDVLDRGVFTGNNSEKLKKDVTWRAQYVGQGMDFWELAKADLPWHIAEGSYLNMNGPSEGIRTTKLEKSTQSLTRHSFFKDAHIARNPFRCFHRSDGFLLTMSPAAGVDYLNANLPLYLDMSPEELCQESFASATAQIFLEFSETGTRTWFRKTVEWFLVYLITEVAVTPHNIRQGYSVPSLMDAYDSIVHELKERRYDRWQRNETINLVRAYLICLDELTVLEGIFSKKLDFFKRLRKDCDTFPQLQGSDVLGNPPDNKQGETPADRIAFAEHMMEESSAQCKRLAADLRESLNTLFQLRSIEQNELAIMADTQNKAIFVFTAVTIVFLPLSFFTSYFGMNLEGIQGSHRTERDFWRVCGSVSFTLLLFTVLYAFRHRIYRRIARYRLEKDSLSG
ncbi:hypothetical protein GE09DRAFT_745718 [Coniochaeta sp. 2T2.1]|nr:hypothetical protein GE09DRAFT_745718 [Coniochaeta sp. 2T2.1]